MLGHPERALMEQEMKQPGQKVTLTCLKTPASSAAFTMLTLLCAHTNFRDSQADLHGDLI